MRRFENITVECVKDTELQEQPEAFSDKNRRWGITEIIDRWYEGGLESGRPPLNYFKVATADGEIFLLRCDLAANEWFVLMK